MVKRMEQMLNRAHPKNPNSEYSLIASKSLTHLTKQVFSKVFHLSFGNYSIVAYRFASEYRCTMSQKRLNISTRSLFFTSSPLNADKSLVMSSATKINSQHDPKNELRNGIAIEYATEPPTHSESHATR